MTDDKRYNAETVLTNVIRYMRKLAYDLGYTAPELWMNRVAEGLQQAHHEAEQWEQAPDIDYKAAVGDLIRGR